MAGKTTKPVPAGDLEVALGRAFRRARKSRKVPLLVLARKLKVSINTIRWHEAGCRMMRTDDVARAAYHLGLPVSTLTTPAYEEDAPK